MIRFRQKQFGWFMPLLMGTGVVQTKMQMDQSDEQAQEAEK
jgi:hypothetical protein